MADRFSEFYARYPRREARKDAEKAWKQVNGDAHFDAILAALAWQAPLYLKREREHRPLPATYLRGERWTDEPPEADRAAAALAKPKPAWYEQAMAHAVQKQGRTA